jgi:hypothetical protein
MKKLWNSNNKMDNIINILSFIILVIVIGGGLQFYLISHSELKIIYSFLIPLGFCVIWYRGIE